MVYSDEMLNTNGDKPYKSADADTEGGTQAEGVWEQGAEENIWA